MSIYYLLAVFFTVFLIIISSIFQSFSRVSKTTVPTLFLPLLLVDSPPLFI